MGLSETIVAAIIGALATMLTAIFQLVRNRAPEGSKPKKNRVRSLLATIALMIGCLVGGYAWSSLRAVSAKQELQATMKAEFAEQFAALAARQSPATSTDDEGAAAPVSALAAGQVAAGIAESLVQLPPCRMEAQSDEVGPVTCTDRLAQPIALCATLPGAARTTGVRILARLPGNEAWQEREIGTTTLGSLHFAAAPEEYAVSNDQRSLCLDVANWSVEETLAVRLVVEYAFAPPPAAELTAATPSAPTL